MKAFTAEATVKEGGKINLDHVPFRTGQRVTVTLTAPDDIESAWPEGYFASTFGAINDDSFIRHPQGDFESREELS